MAKKKKAVAKKKPAAKAKPAAKKNKKAAKPAPKKKLVVKKPAAKKPVAKKQFAAKKKPAPKKAPIEIESRVRAGRLGANPMRKGPGTRSAGQSGDVQGISSVEDVDSESVEELTEEGQDFEAEVVDGVENAPDADEGEVTTHEVPEDDVPGEYLDTE